MARVAGINIPDPKHTEIALRLSMEVEGLVPARFVKLLLLLIQLKLKP